MNHPSTTTDAACRNCAHMHPDKDGGRWCSSPQVLKHLGHSIRCVWEKDSVAAPDRSKFTGTEKCGPESKNWKPRETI